MCVVYESVQKSVSVCVCLYIRVYVCVCTLLKSVVWYGLAGVGKCGCSNIHTNSGLLCEQTVKYSV